MQSQTVLDFGEALEEISYFYEEILVGIWGHKIMTKLGSFAQ